MDTFYKLFGKCRDYILPYLLCFFLNASIFGIYGEGLYSVYNFVSALIILGMFFYFKFLNKHRILGGMIYVVMGFIALWNMMSMIFRGGFMGFESWFLTAGEKNEGQPEYFWALTAVFPFFLSSVVYYFTVILYRTAFLMLGSLVPCALYVKTLTPMSDFYLVCIAGLNAALFARNIGKGHTQSGRAAEFGKNARYVSVIVLTCAALMIASLIPKQGEAIYYDVFEYYFMDSSSSDTGISGGLGEHSGNAGFFRDLDNTLLYNVYAEDLLYYRRQNFDLYSQDEHCWYPMDKYSLIESADINASLGERDPLNFDDMLAAMKKGAELDGDLRSAVSAELLALDSTGEAKAAAYIYPVNYSAQFVLTTVRSTSLTRDNTQNTVAGITPHKEISLVSSSAATPYTLEYYKEFGARDVWAINGGSRFTDDGYSRYITKLRNVLESSGETELAETAAAFQQDFLFARQYKQDCADNLSEIPDDVAELALELTAGMTYDYEKAAALQEYFQSGEYVYDLDYIPPMGRNTASYFIFTSKRGTCSDFATAYTLMARAAGLTVRYTEGFASDITNDENTYVILASGSHAYPEVYLPNMGWTVFEPTVSAAYSTNIDNVNNGGGIQIDTNILFTSALVLCLVFGITAIVIFSVPAVRYAVDEIKIRRGGTPSVLLIYRRISSKYGKRFRVKAENLAPMELADKIKSSLDTDITEAAQIYEAAVFGGIEPDETDCGKCRDIYYSLMKAFKDKKRRK